MWRKGPARSGLTKFTPRTGANKRKVQDGEMQTNAHGHRRQSSGPTRTGECENRSEKCQEK